MKRILDQIELFLLIFTVFMLPIHIKITSLTIGALFVISLLKVDNYKSFLNLFKSFKFYILISPLIASILGLLNTEYIPEAKSQVEIVLSLAVFPFIFTSFSNNQIPKKIEYLLSFYLISIVFAYFICLAVAVPHYFRSRDIDVFFYSHFSSIIKGPHHLSYYVLFAIFLLVFNIIKKLELFPRESKQLRVFKYVSLIIMILFLFQLSSKITILLLVIFFMIMIVYIARNKILNYKQIITISVVMIGMFALMFCMPKPRARFLSMYHSAIDFKVSKKSQESTKLRYAAINAGYHLIQENFWTGVGTGDLSTEMSEYYKENGIKGAYIQHISPHNQFMRTFVMYGIFGFLGLILLFVVMITDAVRTKNTIYLFWSVLMVFLFAVEDMFMIQDGVVFFAMFTSFYMFAFDFLKIKRKVVRVNE